MDKIFVTREMVRRSGYVALERTIFNGIHAMVWILHVPVHVNRHIINSSFKDKSSNYALILCDVKSSLPFKLKVKISNEGIVDGVPQLRFVPIDKETRSKQNLVLAIRLSIGIGSLSEIEVGHYIDV